MNRRQKLISALAGLALLAVCTGASATHSWSDYHWARTVSHFTLKVVDSVTPDWDTELDTALSEWSGSEVLDLEIDSFNDKNNVRRRCNSVAGQIRVCNAAYGFNGWLGLATIYIDSNGNITRGTAKMNDSYASYWTIAGEKNHVMCQEIGHLFGLTHTSEDGSSQGTCMDYSTDPESQWPNAHDFEELAAKYAHLDSYDSFDGATSGDGGGGCNAPAGKGCNKNAAGEVPPMGIRIRANQNFELWVAPGKEGGLWIHHVRLVPEDYDVQ